MAYGSSTSVPVEKSRTEIEVLLRRYGATSFAYYQGPNRAAVVFVKDGRQVRFSMPMPDPNERRFTHTASTRVPRSASVAHASWEQACRQKWRALVLIIRAKLEAVEAGIVSFEEEFLAHTVLPGGVTVFEYVAPQIEKVYAAENTSLLRIGPA